MLCYSVCTRRHGRASHIVATLGIEAHMANFPLSPLPIYDSHVPQFLRNVFGRRHRPASCHALIFCHSRRLQRPQTLILRVASMDNVHILVPFFSETRFPLPGHGHFLFFYCPDTDSLCCQHPSRLFADVDCCITISVHLISTRTAIDSFG